MMMKSMAKIEIFPLKERYRKKITLTIDPSNHFFIKDTGVNVSQILDMAIYALRMKMDYDTLITTLIANSELKKNTKNKASGGNRTRDLFLTKEARYRYATEAIVVSDNELPV